MITELDVLRPRAGEAVVELRDEEDTEPEEELHRLLALLVEQNQLVVVDVGQARFIGSALLRNLALADRLARRRGSRFRVRIGELATPRRPSSSSGLPTSPDSLPGRVRALGDSPDRPGYFLG